MVAIGCWILAGFNVVLALMFATFEMLYSSSLFSLFDKLPGLMAIAGGVTLAIGWGGALKHPRADLRAIGIVGMIAAILFGLLGLISLMGSGFMATEYVAGWFEIVLCALAVVGCVLWNPDLPCRRSLSRAAWRSAWTR